MSEFMMTFNKHLQVQRLALAILLTFPLSLTPQASLAEEEAICNSPDGYWTQPSRSEREFKDERYGFAFMVPTNYRVVAHRGDIFFIMPDELFATYRCQIQNNEFRPLLCRHYQCTSRRDTPVLNTLTLSIHEIPDSDKNKPLEFIIERFLDENRSEFLLYNTFEPYHGIGIDNRIPTFQYRLHAPASPCSMPVINFLSPDRRYLIQFAYGGENESSPHHAFRVWERVLETFRFF
jgi:hypothetical protein